MGMSWASVVRLLRSLGHTVLVEVLGFAALLIAYLVADPNSGAPVEGAIWAVLYVALIYGLVYLFQVLATKKPLAATGFFHRPLRSTVAGIGLATLVFGAILTANLLAGSLRYAGPITAADGGVNPFAASGWRRSLSRHRDRRGTPCPRLSVRVPEGAARTGRSCNHLLCGILTVACDRR